MQGRTWRRRQGRGLGATRRMRSRRRAFLYDYAVLHADDPLRVARHALVVRDEDDGQALLLVEPLQHPQHFLGRARVEIPGRLVGEQQFRAVDECPGDGYALLLAARERGRLVVHTVGQADEPQHRLRVALAVGFRGMRWRVVQRHARVVQRTGPRQQVEVLEDEPDLGVAQGGALVGRQRRDFLPLEAIAAGRGPVQAAEDVHQRALARAARTDQRDELAAGNRQ